MVEITCNIGKTSIRSSW